VPEGRASGGHPDDSAAERPRGVAVGVADGQISTGRPLALGEVDVNPLYRQVASRIREAILRGDVEPGARLPTERKLAETFGVSRTSIREALRELEAQGLISPSRAAQTRRVASGPCHEAIRDALASVLVLQQVSLTHLLQLCGAVEAVAVRVAAEATARRRPDCMRPNGPTS
jgi:DNA-binding FadR family transcriptional regulator